MCLEMREVAVSSDCSVLKLGRARYCYGLTSRPGFG